VGVLTDMNVGSVRGVRGWQDGNMTAKQRTWKIMNTLTVEVEWKAASLPNTRTRLTIQSKNSSIFSSAFDIQYLIYSELAFVLSRSPECLLDTDINPAFRMSKTWGLAFPQGIKGKSEESLKMLVFIHCPCFG